MYIPQTVLTKMEQETLVFRIYLENPTVTRRVGSICVKTSGFWQNPFSISAAGTKFAQFLLEHADARFVDGMLKTLTENRKWTSSTPSSY